MKSYTIKDYKDIEKNINDNHFGSQSIDGAYICIYPVYSDYVDYSNKIEDFYFREIDTELYNLMLEQELF